MIVVLYQPQIPQNCGNIVRTCSVTGSDLILVGPLGFKTNDRWLKRAGLDYWEGVHVNIVESLEEALSRARGQCFFFSSKATQRYDKLHYGPHDALVFGSETTGLPQQVHERYPNLFATVPMCPNKRCLNLATTVGIVVYEAWRQQDFRTG